MPEKITMSNRGEKTVKEAYDLFIRSRLVMNVSDDTIRFYNVSCKWFLEYVGENELCKNITHNTVTDYMFHLKETKPNLSPKSFSTYIRALRAVLNYCMENGFTEKFTIKLPKTEETIKEVYTDYEIQCLVRKPNVRDCSFSELRSWALVCYFLATGNRLSSAANVQIRDVNFEIEEILIKKTKNKKQQIIPISKELRSVLQEYLQYRQGEPEDYLFCNVYGNQLTRYAMVSCIQVYNRSRGVEKTSIHLFRHTFAKNWIINGGDIFRLQKILGHSTLDMVKNYVAIYGGDLKRDYDKFSVLDQARQAESEAKGQRLVMKRK